MLSSSPRNPQKNIFLWLIFPVAYLTAIFGVSVFNEQALTIFPAFSSGYKESLRDFLPPHPENVPQAWRLGQISVLVNTSLAADNQTAVDAYLEEARQLIRRTKPITVQELHAVGAVIADPKGGLISRVLGAFTLVNIIWGIAILGITCTVLPFLWFVSGPLRAVLVGLGEFIMKLVISCQPLYPPVLYLVALTLFVESMRYPSDDKLIWTGTYLGLTAIMITLFAWLYSSALHAPDSPNARVSDFYCMTWGFVSIAAIPVAIRLQSSFLGFICVAGGCAMMGFSMACYGCCWVLGWNDKAAMCRTSIATLSVNLFFILARMFNVDAYYLRPFALGVGSLGCSVFLLSMVIMSSYYYRMEWPQRASQGYIVRNLWAIASIAVFIVFGSLFHMDAMRNTAVTFALLFAGEKYSDLGSKAPIWPYLFFGFVGLWQLALYLSKHPEMVVTLFQTSYNV